MKRDLTLTLSAGVLAVGLVGGSQYAFAQQTSPPVATIVAQEKVTSAVVEDVDPTAHQVLLRLSDDTLVTLNVDPKVADLSKLAPGDHVSAEYIEAKLIDIGQTAGPTGPIQNMSAGPGTTVQGPSTIVAVDPTAHTVSFVGPDNRVETIRVAGDAKIDAVTKLRPGDHVQVAYTPAIAVSLHSA
jgi:hypothetical protein